MKRLSLLFLLLIALLSFNCQTSLYTLTNTEQALTAVPTNQVKVTTMETLPTKYQELGYAFAIGGSESKAVENLKERAGKMGGDQVLKLELIVIRQYVFLIPVDDFYAGGMIVKTM